MITLSDVTVTYPRRDRASLRGVDLHVAAGERVVVLGPSGAGKSTLLHLVAGLVPHSTPATVTGTLSLATGTTGPDTRESSTVPAPEGEGRTRSTVLDLDSPVRSRARLLGLVGQDPSASVCLPQVDSEVAFVLENQAVPPERIGTRVAAALDEVGAGALSGRQTARLSGGETQRVALAAAVVGRPRVLLLDEPTSMLDPRGVRAVRSAVDTVSRDATLTVLLVEHRLDDYAGEGGVDALPGRAVVLDHDGSVVADGPTRTVLREHARRLHALGCWLPLESELAAIAPVVVGSEEGATDGDAVGPDRARDRASGTAVDRGQADDADGSRARGLDSGVHDAWLAGLVVEPALCSAGTAGPPSGPGPRSSRSLLRARGVAVGHGRRQVLGGVDLDLTAGEVVAVLGENGTGKSTLLHVLAGLARPLAGTVSGPRPGMVFQNPEHQLVAATVRAEIAHGRADPEVTVARMLRQHRLEHLADRNPHQLSGGEKRRLSLAAMLAHERPVLLADEPTFGLDRRDTAAASTALRRFADDGGAVLLATHDLRLAAEIADRVVVVGEGGVVVQGQTHAVLSRVGGLVVDPSSRAGGDPRAAGADVTGAGALVVPAIVRWFLPRCSSTAQLRGALTALRDATVTERAVQGCPVPERLVPESKGRDGGESGAGAAPGGPLVLRSVPGPLRASQEVRA